MLETLVDALLPIVVTLSLGFAAGWHHDFTQEQSLVLNRMVMLYALPLSTFAGLVSLSRAELFADLSMFLWLALAMAGGYLAVFLISRFLFGRPRQVAALQALAISGPAVPFVGVSVLGSLFGQHSSMAVAACTLLMNLVQVPLCLVLLGPPEAEGAKSPARGAAALAANMGHAFKEPVVWLPLAGFVLVLAGFHLSGPWRNSFTLLGGATGGVALFASGIVLYAQKVSFSPAVAVNVLAKNILLPALAGLGMYLAGTGADTRSMALIALAIPTASISIILAVQYRCAEKEIASTLFISTFSSVFTLAGFIWLSGVN